ncbi:hypothetical protein CVD28_08850 [Bacillus sp. M6-12]|uniref:phenylacetate--CoA ligase family protein n=1 Tax=Bacillus sp. M6-12 TaxID=2054166 RepID=UPI000C77DA84|nr:phenylacetate--CoA ligase family protein [Bacillus sp. M6-12]PLS17799.1 hypothetical protein CVD28_08850 [Bacillus sp. M6-12]
MGLTEKLFYFAPVPFQNALISLYGHNRRKYRYNDIFWGKLPELERTQNCSKDELKEIQLKSFQKIVEHSYNTTEFYKKEFDKIGLTPDQIKNFDDIKKIPIIDKEDVRSNEHIMISNFYSKQQLTTVNTSGSTGKPLTIHRVKSSHGIENAFVWRQRRWAGLNFNDKVLTIAGRTFSKANQKNDFFRYNLADNQLLLSAYHINKHNIKKMIDEINRFKPIYIQGYPSSIALLSSLIQEEGLSVIPVKAVFTSSENLLPFQRSIIEREFNTTVFDYYGNGEQVASISQCEHGSYHINSEYGLIEEVDGEFIATGFVNYAMPFIRYKIGDSGDIVNRDCKCGRGLPIVNNLFGRTSSNFIETPSGVRLAHINQVFKLFKNVTETQIVQDKIDHLVVKVVPRDNFNLKDEQLIKYELELRLGSDIKIDVDRVSYIERTKNGKFLPIVNNVHNK